MLVRAAGYAPDERNVVAIEHGLVALDVALRPLPATLEVVGEDGAQLYVDGERRAELPTPRPVELPAGRHLLAVVRRGHRPFERALDFRRGTHTRIALELPPTPQRYAAFGAFGLGAAGAGVTVVLAVLAAGSKQQADDLRALQQAGPITEAQRQEHNDAVARRDDLLWATAASGAATGLVALSALGLLVFDMPPPAPPAIERARRGAGRSSAARAGRAGGQPLVAAWRRRARRAAAFLVAERAPCRVWAC